MSKQRGMSLIEVLVSMVILAIIMVGVTQFIANQTQTVRQQEMLAALQQNVRTSMDVMVRDLRSAEYDTINTENTSPFRTFGVADSNTIVFYTDLNGNGAININPGSQIDNELKGFQKLSADGDDLYIIQRWNPLTRELMAKNIRDLEFTYFNSGDSVMPAPVANLGRIFAVRIRIVGEAPRNWSRQAAFKPVRELTAKIQIRSRQGT